MTAVSGVLRVSKYLSGEEGRALVAAWRASGLSRVAFARERGIGAHVVQYWSQKLSTLSGESRVEPPSSGGGFVAVALSGRSALSSPLRIEFSAGVVVHVGVGVDAGLLRAVVQVLRASC